MKSQTLLTKVIWLAASLLPIGLTRPAAADHVIMDDCIIDGSMCVGNDCVNGEAFGFDTIRLKENNLRIKFQDTSVAAGFPTQDWQLTANASGNGGHLTNSRSSQLVLRAEARFRF